MEYFPGILDNLENGSTIFQLWKTRYKSCLLSWKIISAFYYFSVYSE